VGRDPPDQARLGQLAEEQAALRRVATLVARGAVPEEVFAAVAEEVGRQLLPVDSAALCRYEPDDALTFVSQWGRSAARFPVGSRWPLVGYNIGTIVFETGRPARVDRSGDSSADPIGAASREAGIRSAVGTPIIVEGRLWGLITVTSYREQPLPPDTEARLASFTELVATAVANAEGRAALARLAEEQAALRRVATLVARATPPEEVFAAVAEEAGRLLPFDSASLVRYESDRTVTSVATWGMVASAHFPVGSRWPLEGHNLGTLVFETGRPARLDRYGDSSSGPIGAAAREQGVRSAVGTPIIVEGRLWGAILADSTLEQPLPADTETRLASFTELVATAIANTESRAALARLAEEQAALRRVATLVARATPPQEVFAAVAGEVGRLLAVDFAILVRYDPQGTLEVVGSWTRTGAPAATPVGGRLPLGGRNVTTLVYQTGRPARIDYRDSDVSGVIGQVASRDWGLRSSVGVPVSAESRVWGCIVVAFSDQERLPGGTETRLAGFTELVATAIANTESRTSLARLAEEQAALRRVATLVARGVQPAEIFSAVAGEICRLIGADNVGVCRFEPDGAAVVIVGDAGPVKVPVGASLDLPHYDPPAAVWQTGRPARVDEDMWSGVPGPHADALRALGIRSMVASPINVEGRLWGVVNASTTRGPFPPGTADRLADFTELVATAVGNAESRAELAASRVRIVAASDQARRRIERDLHDGTQQRLVSLGLTARIAEADVTAGRGDPRAEFSRIATGLADAVAELQELSRGIHPAILSERGLGPALRTLARRSAVPVDLDVTTSARCPEPVEVAAYYVASEALANAMKHAQASRLEISLATRHGSLLLSIRDDGVGGADPARGSGLAGLTDRVEALGGSIHVHSAAGAGTHITVDLPLEYELAQGAG
jgi:GAF domain-containing protein